MPLGIVEELFIATDPTTGLREVWYRNSNVTQSLAIRNLLNANPVGVNWGTWKSQFVVRTGTTSATHQYFIFNLVRVGLSSGADGIGPSAVAHYVRTETPATSTLPLVMVTGSTRVTTFREGTLFETRGHLVDNGVTCDSVVDSLGGSLLENSIIDTGSRSYSVTVGNLLTNSAGVDFGLDSSGDLILTITRAILGQAITNGNRATTTYSEAVPHSGGCAPTATTVNTAITPSLVPRAGETHLFIVNNTRNLVLFQTAKRQVILSRAQFLTSAAAPYTGGLAVEHKTIPGLVAGACGALAVDTCDTPAGPNAGTTANIGLGTFSVGITTFSDEAWLSFSLIDNEIRRTFSTVTTTHGPTSVFGGAIQTPGGTAAQYTYTYTWTDTTYTAQTFWTYSVLGAWPIRFARPLQVVLWIRRRSSGPEADQHGLFLWEENTGRFTTIYPFTDISPADTFFVVTGRTRDIIWTIGDGLTATAGDVAFLHDLETDRKVGLTTDTLHTGALFARFYKMLDFRHLYRAEETAASPPGTFISAWNAGGDPLEYNVTNPNTVSALTPFASLAALPSGVSAPPVIGRFFQRDVIMKDDWFNITGGVPPLPPDGVGTDTGGAGDPVMRAVILCSPSDNPGAFIARFPGRSDGAGGSPGPLEITASGRITENQFTSALSAQRYEDEAVVAFRVSANTSAQVMLAQEIQSSGVDVFRCIVQPSVQANPGADTHRAEAVEMFIRRGPGQTHPGSRLMSVAPVTSNILDNQGGTVGTERVFGLSAAVSPVKAPIGQMATGRFLSWYLKASNVNSAFRYLGSLIRGRRTT